MPPDATDQARALLKSLRWWDEDGWARDHGYDALDVQAAEAALSAAREAGKAEGLKRAAEGSSPMLAAGILAVRDLIGDSRGVAGLHRNGDEAPWDDLRTGGRFEEWLIQFDDALKVAEALAREAGK